CTTMKTVNRCVAEKVCEQYTVPGRCKWQWCRGNNGCGNNCNSGCGGCGDACGSNCNSGCGNNCNSGCGDSCNNCCSRRSFGSLQRVQTPDQCCTRMVTKYHTVCEQVPCTTYVRESHVEKVPY